jgi:hypothetical protein
VRDGLGGVSYAAATVNVTSSPFEVLTQATPTAWTGNTQRSISWKVESPKIAQNVNVYLWDGANWRTLLAETPNDGSTVVTIPNIASTQCRLLVRGSKQAFYAMSKATFAITPGAGAAEVLIEGAENANSGWTVSHLSGTKWQRRNGDAFVWSGSSAFTVGGGTYANNSSSKLFTPIFNFNGQDEAELTFLTKYKTEQDYDRIIIGIQTTQMGTEYIEFDGYSGSEYWPGWVEFTIDLSPYAKIYGNTPVRLVFHFVSDSSSVSWGATIDDIKVTAH